LVPQPADGGIGEHRSHGGLCRLGKRRQREQPVHRRRHGRLPGAVKVKRGGSVEIEGATLSGGLSAKGAVVVRVCGASIAGSVKINGSTGAVVLGDVSEECAASSVFGAATVGSNTGGVRIEGQALINENAFHGSLKVSGNSAGTTVVDNLVDGSLTVKGNSAPVTDSPNTVEGKAKVQ
jgi:hypothetical protein